MNHVEVQILRTDSLEKMIEALQCSQATSRNHEREPMAQAITSALRGLGDGGRAELDALVAELVASKQREIASRAELERVRSAMGDLVVSCTDVYKTGRIAAEPFVCARNLLGRSDEASLEAKS